MDGENSGKPYEQMGWFGGQKPLALFFGNIQMVVFHHGAYSSEIASSIFARVLQHWNSGPTSILSEIIHQVWTLKNEVCPFQNGSFIGVHFNGRSLLLNQFALLHLQLQIWCRCTKIYLPWLKCSWSLTVWNLPATQECGWILTQRSITYDVWFFRISYTLRNV